MLTKKWRGGLLVSGALLFVLAAFVAVTSVTSLLGYSEPKPTHPGIATRLEWSLIRLSEGVGGIVGNLKWDHHSLNASE